MVNASSWRERFLWFLWSLLYLTLAVFAPLLDVHAVHAEDQPPGNVVPDSAPLAQKVFYSAPVPGYWANTDTTQYVQQALDEGALSLDGTPLQLALAFTVDNTQTSPVALPVSGMYLSDPSGVNRITIGKRGEQMAVLVRGSGNPRVALQFPANADGGFQGTILMAPDGQTLTLITSGGDTFTVTADAPVITNGSTTIGRIIGPMAVLTIGDLEVLSGSQRPRPAPSAVTQTPRPLVGDVDGWLALTEKVGNYRFARPDRTVLSPEQLAMVTVQEQEMAAWLDRLNGAIQASRNADFLQAWNEFVAFNNSMVISDNELFTLFPQFSFPSALSADFTYVVQGGSVVFGYTTTRNVSNSAIVEYRFYVRDYGVKLDYNDPARDNMVIIKFVEAWNVVKMFRRMQSDVQPGFIGGAQLAYANANGLLNTLSTFRTVRSTLGAGTTAPLLRAQADLYAQFVAAYDEIVARFPPDQVPYQFALKYVELFKLNIPQDQIPRKVY